MPAPRRRRSRAATAALRDLDAALARASTDRGVELVWGESEAKARELLADTVDRLESLRSIYTAEQAEDVRPAVLVKLSAEMRQLERTVLHYFDEITRSLDPSAPVGKSPRHQRAAQARWLRSVGGA